MAKLVEFINPNSYTVQIIGPDKRTISVPRYAKIVLSDWFIDKYSPKYLKVVRYISDIDDSKTIGNIKATKILRNRHTTKLAPTKKPKPKLPRQKQTPNIIAVRRKNLSNSSGKFIKTNGVVVGKRVTGDVNKLYKEAIANDIYPISNDVGVGILSYNRLGSIQRLIYSIRRFTDLSRTTVFVSDESSNQEVKDWLEQQNDIVLLNNNERLGVAGNSNRLLRCLERFKYKIILNDDVEIMHSGWENFYFDAIKKTGIHHFCYRQNGIYGATNLDITRHIKNDITINTVTRKPHGSVLAFDDEVFNAVGYFDESFGEYGMEHIDWSMRVATAKIQQPGFHDLQNSDKYFKIWNEESAIHNKTALLSESKLAFSRAHIDSTRTYVEPTQASDVATIGYVIPCRAFGNRKDSINTVINNIKAQKFPRISITVVEHDTNSKLNSIQPTKHILLKCDDQTQFHKTAAFNIGVMKQNCDVIILHDADILVPSWYTMNIYNNMLNNESCHIGKQVIYMTPKSTEYITIKNKLYDANECEHAVDYFEGGSLAVNKNTFIKIGGFDEMFIGYGVEDCEFYQRISECTKFNNNRYVKFIHLWHDRQPGWELHHQTNRNYFFSTKDQMSVYDRCAKLRGLLKNRYS
jgi:GT2 family glycosyltransferase